MKFDKILIYGSSHLSAVTCDLLRHHYDVVGYIPSSKPTIAGEMNMPRVYEEIEHDIKLSLQYDKKLVDIENAFNVHTGLLPQWGGTDILYHTLQEEAIEQGLTFHKMTNKFDYGAIISKISYPVFKTDSMVDLYEKMTRCFPNFVLSSLRILESIEDISGCQIEKPRLFKRGNINSSDTELYKNTLIELKEKYEKMS